MNHRGYKSGRSANVGARSTAATGPGARGFSFLSVLSRSSGILGEVASRYDVLTEQRGDDVQGGSSEGYKRPIGLALGVLFASILVACGGSGSNQTAGSTTPATSQPPTTQSTPEEEIGRAHV